MHRTLFRYTIYTQFTMYKVDANSILCSIYLVPGSDICAGESSDKRWTMLVHCCSENSDWFLLLLCFMPFKRGNVSRDWDTFSHCFLSSALLNWLICTKCFLVDFTRLTYTVARPRLRARSLLDSLWHRLGSNQTSVWNDVYKLFGLSH